MSQHPLIRVNGAVYSLVPPPLMGNSDNATSILPSIATFNIGNGFIEIAALTSLIGSATAQALALGNKGPAGLVWATMTIFGGMSVVRAGIATVTPGWVRDSLGVRSTETDSVVGLSLNLNTKGIRYRTRAGVAKGVECEIKNLDQPLETARRDIHVFNQQTIYILNAVLPAAPGDALRIYTYRQDPYYTETTSHQAWVDWTWMTISLVKLAEVFTLRQYNAIMLAWVSLLTWGFFLLAAATLQIHGYWKAYVPSKRRTVVDTIVASSLPVPSSAGGTRKVVLGIPKGERGGIIWKVFWTISSLVCTVSVILTYMALGQAPSREVFFVWTGFQILWIALRSTFFHIVEDRERPYLASLKGKLWKEVGATEKIRVRNLVHTLAKYQYHVHPRGPWSYNEDLQTLNKVENIHSRYPSAASDGKVVEVFVSEVIGDTMLSSAAWILGSKKGGFDFYDTCIMILRVKGEEIAIPAARVLSAVKPKVSTDEEQGDEPERPPRGSSNMGFDIEWWFWVPYGDGRWLHFKSQDLKFKGRQVADILTDNQVTEKLEKGELYVSLKHVDEVKEIVETSTEACKHLLTLFT